MLCAISSDDNMARRIILCDLDGTLINEKYTLTVLSKQIRKAIQKKQSQGWLIGLNSDTPLEPLKSWARRFGMNGPLIGEKGQVLATSSEEPPQILGTMAEFFLNLKRKVVLQVHEEMPRAFIGVGDVTEFRRKKGKIYGEDHVAVLINGYRLCSFSGYALACQHNQLVNDPEVFDRFCKLVLSVVDAEKEGLEVDKNLMYGILILHEKRASKTLAVERLIKSIRPEIECVMIGDGDSDVIVLDHPVKLCAVGNASPLLKERARETGGIVAKGTYTQGVIEILTRL